MSDYLQHLVTRVLSPGGAIRPRQISIFEPVVAEEPAAEYVETVGEADAPEIAREARPQSGEATDVDDIAAEHDAGKSAEALREVSPKRRDRSTAARESGQRQHRSPVAKPDADEIREAQATRAAVPIQRSTQRPRTRPIDLSAVPRIERSVIREQPEALAAGHDAAPTRSEGVQNPARFRGPTAVRELQPSSVPAGPTEVAPVRLPMAPAPMPDRAWRKDSGRPAVQVSIGRVEVRPRASAAPTRPQPATTAAAPKLEEYLQQRRGGSR